MYLTSQVHYMNPIHIIVFKVQTHVMNPTHKMHVKCDLGEYDDDGDDDEDQDDGDGDGGDAQQLPESNV